MSISYTHTHSPIGLEILRRFDVYNTFNCDEQTFKSWLIVIEAHYPETNTYHNSTHAADVMQVSDVTLQLEIGVGITLILIYVAFILHRSAMRIPTDTDAVI